MTTTYICTLYSIVRSSRSSNVGDFFVSLNYMQNVRVVHCVTWHKKLQRKTMQRIPCSTLQGFSSNLIIFGICIHSYRPRINSFLIQYYLTWKRKNRSKVNRGRNGAQNGTNSRNNKAQNETKTGMKHKMELAQK